MKIMVVDDEPDMVYILRIILEKEGHSVVETYTGKECLQKLKSEKIDIILLDDIMPGIGGWETLKAIKEDGELSSIPVVMLTTIPLAELFKRGEALDTAYYLPKPFERSDLLELIEYIRENY